MDESCVKNEKAKEKKPTPQRRTRQDAAPQTIGALFVPGGRGDVRVPPHRPASPRTGWVCPRPRAMPCDAMRPPHTSGAGRGAGGHRQTKAAEGAGVGAGGAFPHCPTFGLRHPEPGSAPRRLPAAFPLFPSQPHFLLPPPVGAARSLSRGAALFPGGNSDGSKAPLPNGAPTPSAVPLTPPPTAGAQRVSATAIGPTARPLRCAPLNALRPLRPSPRGWELRSDPPRRSPGPSAGGWGDTKSPSTGVNRWASPCQEGATLPLRSSFPLTMGREMLHRRAAPAPGDNGRGRR